MTNRSKALRYAVMFLLIIICSPLLGQEKDEEPTQLLNHLAGNWVLEGVLGKSQVTHDITAEWILNHEYLRLHEVSREKNKNGDPAYEANYHHQLGQQSQRIQMPLARQYRRRGTIDTHRPGESG
jgi:hypothetical protein